MSVKFSIRTSYVSSTPYDFDSEYNFESVHLDEAVYHIEAILRASGFVFDRVEVVNDREEEELPQLDFDFELT